MGNQRGYHPSASSSSGKMRRCAAQESCCCPDVLDLCGRLLRRVKSCGREDEREKYERTIRFLASVPLFKMRLPPSELPLVAQALREKCWRSGSRLVKQGDMGSSFFLVCSGHASVLHVDEDGHEHESAVLGPGDWLGGHTLVAERPNNMTVRARGPLVTLSMSKRQFEESGLKARLRFPKRPAMHWSTNPVVARALGQVMPNCGGGDDDSSHVFHAASASSARGPKKEASPRRKSAVAHANSMTALNSVTREAQDFIVDSMLKNANLSACLAGLVDEEEGAASEDVARRIAASAERRAVRSGEVVAERGDIGQELFVVQSGSFEVVVGGPEAPAGASPSGPMGAIQRHLSGGSLDKPSTGSAEEAAARFSLAERLRRKQGFMLQLHKPAQAPVNRKGGHSWSGSETCRAAPTRWQASPPTSNQRPRLRADTAADPSVSVPLGSLGGRASRNLSKVSSLARSRRKPTLTAQATGAALGTVHVTLAAGDCFGELSLLYNVPREATFRALQDSVVYAVSRRHFKQCAPQKNGGRRRLREYCALLDEVNMLSGLLNAERQELACNATAVSFGPKVRVLHQGKARQNPQWYVISAGTAVMTTVADGQEKARAEIGRGSHFGERSLLRAALRQGSVCCSEVSVDAGPEGMTCLTFDGIMVLDLLKGLAHLDPNGPHLDSDITEWCMKKGQCGKKVACDVELERLEKVTLLGSGNFGNVFLARNPSTRQLYALKRLSKGYVQSSGTAQQVCWERDLMTMLDSPFVVKLVSTYKDAQFVYLLMEACLGGNLYELLCSHPEIFNEDQPRGSSAVFYAACMVAALEHLHVRSIVYRDLKPENVLLDTAGYGKLCDMGLARFVCGKANTQAGTPDYMAPEVIHFPHLHDCTTDWWSCGCVVFELLAGQTPFDDEGLDDDSARLLAIKRSQERPPLFPFNFPTLAKSFVADLLQLQPRRLGTEGGTAAVKRHAFFQGQGLDFEALQARRVPSPISPAWQEPEGPGHPQRFRASDADGHDELFEPYRDDGSGWDKDF